VRRGREDEDGRERVSEVRYGSGIKESFDEKGGMDPWMWEKEDEMRDGERDRMVNTFWAVGNWMERLVSWESLEARPLGGWGWGMPIPNAPKGPGTSLCSGTIKPSVCEML